jgi:hypothetical protein
MGMTRGPMGTRPELDELCGDLHQNPVRPFGSPLPDSTPEHCGTLTHTQVTFGLLVTRARTCTRTSTAFSDWGLHQRGTMLSFEPRPNNLYLLPAGRMNTSAIITFVVIAGIVWGGFLVIAVTAIRKESRKSGEG